MHLAVDGGQSQIRARSSQSPDVATVPGLSRLEGDLTAALVARVAEATARLAVGTGPLERVALGLSTLPEHHEARLDLLEALGEALPAAEKLPARANRRVPLRCWAASGPPCDARHTEGPRARAGAMVSRALVPALRGAAEPKAALAQGLCSRALPACPRSCFTPFSRPSWERRWSSS